MLSTRSTPSPPLPTGARILQNCDPPRAEPHPGRTLRSVSKNKDKVKCQLKTTNENKGQNTSTDVVCAATSASVFRCFANFWSTCSLSPSLNLHQHMFSLMRRQHWPLGFKNYCRFQTCRLLQVRLEKLRSPSCNPNAHVPSSAVQNACEVTYHSTV